MARPRILERIAEQQERDVVSLVVETLNNHPAENKQDTIAATSEALGVSSQTIRRFVDAHLDRTCVWHDRAKKPVIGWIEAK